MSFFFFFFCYYRLASLRKTFSLHNSAYIVLYGFPERIKDKIQGKINGLLNSLYVPCHFFFYYYYRFNISLAVPSSIWDLSSPTRDRSHTPLQWKWSLNQWITRKFLSAPPPPRTVPSLVCRKAEVSQASQSHRVAFSSS